MILQVNDQKSYKIHTMKTDRFKTSRIEIVFRTKVEQEKLPIRSFLCSMFKEGSKKYPTRRDIAIKLEDLYNPYFNCYTNKVGDSLHTIFSLTFINPEFIEEKEYLENAIKFLFDMILKPNVHNNEFDLLNFELVKKNILLDIKSIEENPEKKAINAALKTMDETSSSSFEILGSKEDIENITPSKLYNEYLELINKDNVDIFVIGNTNMDNIVSLIKKNYSNHNIRNNKLSYYIDNKLRKKVLEKEDTSTFLQTQLVMLFNLKNLTKNEKEVTFHILNYILGSGGLSSKLYKYIREENSYCYGISSMYFKYDNLLCISSSLSKENINHTIKLVRKAIKEMQKGDFTDQDIVDAKQNLLLSLNINKNNPNYELSSYEFKVFLDNYTIEEKIESLAKITKEDIVSLAKKIQENTIYTLNEE